MGGLEVMHPYTIDRNERPKVYFLILIISIITAWLMHEILLKDWDFYDRYSWLFDLPSAFGLLGLYFFLFNNYLWKYFSKHKLGIYTPVLGGKYTGYLKSSYDGHVSEVPITLIVNQNWSGIKIYLVTSKSNSESEMAAIETEGAEVPKLVYQYLNNDIKIIQTGMEMHRGLTILIYDENEKKFSGRYFTDQHRNGNYGTIEVTESK